MLYKSFLITCILLSILTCQAQTVADVDGNIYNTITIGTQTWMKENLKTTHFNNGIAIPTTTLAANNDSTSVFQWPYNDDVANVATYGRLYTWYAITGNNNVCPAGWHVPDNSEWQALANFLGGDSIAAAKMKETGTSHWAVTNSSVTNSSSFTGLPGGFRGNPQGYNQLGSTGWFWSVTPFGSSGFQRGFHFDLLTNSNYLMSAVAVSNCGMSVRCLKDLTTGIRALPSQDPIRLFPNPATGDVRLEFDDAVERQLYIYDAKGSLVSHITTTNKVHFIPLGNLERGVYFLRIVEKGNVVEKKFVKE